MIQIIRKLFPVILLTSLISCNDGSDLITEEKSKLNKGQHEILFGMTLGKSLKSQRLIAVQNGLMPRLFEQGPFTYDESDLQYIYQFEPLEGIIGYTKLNTLTKSNIGKNWQSVEALNEFKTSDELLVSVDVIYARKNMIDTNYFIKDYKNSQYSKKISRNEFYEMEYSREFEGRLYKKFDYRCDSTGFYEIAELFEKKYGKTEPWDRADKSGDYAVDLDHSDDLHQPLKKRWQLGQTRIELSLDFLYSEVDDDFNPTFNAWTVKATYTFTNDIWQEIGTIQQLRNVDDEFQKEDKELKGI